jgi:hypothetical protein
LKELVKIFLLNPSKLGLDELNEYVSAGLLLSKYEQGSIAAGIIDVLSQSQLSKFAGYGDLIDHVWINRQAFSSDQLDDILRCVVSVYPNLENAVVRMQALVLLVNLTSNERTAEILLALGKKQLTLNRPIDEIVWELNGLVNSGLSNTKKLSVQKFIETSAAINSKNKTKNNY